MNFYYSTFFSLSTAKRRCCLVLYFPLIFKPLSRASIFPIFPTSVMLLYLYFLFFFFNPKFQSINRTTTKKKITTVQKSRKKKFQKLYTFHCLVCAVNDPSRQHFFPHFFFPYKVDEKCKTVFCLGWYVIDERKLIICEWLAS